jgi:hypothetical protein
MMAARMLRGRGKSADWRILHESLALPTLAALAVLALLGDHFMHPSLLDTEAAYAARIAGARALGADACRRS